MTQAAIDFTTIAGHSELQDRLRTLYVSQSLPSAILFTGKQGIGKRLLAAYTASLYTCSEAIPACGQCPNCRLILHNTHPEVFWLDAEATEAGQIKIEDIAGLQDHLSYFATCSSDDAQSHGKSPAITRKRQRVAVIIEADRMTEQAANRLLKTLEEPPDGACFILTTSRPGALLPTIRSRVVRWPVQVPPQAVAATIVRNHCGELNGGSQEQKIASALARAGGAPGLALKYLKDDEEHANAHELIKRLLVEGDQGVVLRIAEELARGFGWNAAMIADRCEWELNQIYRALWQDPPGSPVATGMKDAGELPDVSECRKRRRLLSQMRALAGRRRIQLNAQLMAEAIGLKGN